MKSQALRDIATKIFADSKGLLAMDEALPLSRSSPRRGLFPGSRSTGAPRIWRGIPVKK